MKYTKQTSPLKDIKVWIAFLLLIVLFPILTVYYLKSENHFLLMIPILILGFFIFNLVIRKSLSFKKYFTNPYNLLTSKASSEKTFDISKELMFEKIIEVIKHSEFKLADVDKDKLEILATSKMTGKSWGENLYISFETIGNKTVMKFCSVTLFQMYAWGKNEKNCDDFLNEIESSFTI